MNSRPVLPVRALEEAVLGAIRSAAATAPGRVWGLGLSGGLDSVVLAEGLRRAGLPFVALHLDHAWRATSRGDALWVRDWCRERKVPFRTRRLRRAPANEAAARGARLDFFRDAAGRDALAGVWLAQHADDLVETFFLQLLRGAGPGGLASLQPDREVRGLRLVRPLLAFDKGQLRRLARRWKLEWREDESNQSDRHRRNRIRHRLLPALRRWADRDPVPLIERTVAILAAENEHWEALLPQDYPERVDVRALAARSVAYQRRYLHAWLKSQGVDNAGFEQIESARRLLAGGRPAKANLSGNRHLRRTGGRLYIE